jgi:hypothetical protein
MTDCADGFAGLPEIGNKPFECCVIRQIEHGAVAAGHEDPIEIGGSHLG